MSSYLYKILYVLHPLELLKNLINITKMFKVILFKQITFYPKFVIKFEKDFANLIGTKYALSFCNGTSALEAILYSIDLKKNDEIIVPSATFHASFSPVFSFGAKPVFVDINLQNGFIDIKEIKKKINNNTKAIICVYLFGNAVDNSELFNLCKKNKIKLIEDCSHCHGAKVNSKIIGSNSDASFFSLQGSKAVAAGEGGILCTNDHDIFIKSSAYGHFNRHSDQFTNISKIKNKKHFGYGKKLRANPLGIILASTDLIFLNIYNKILLKNTKIITSILERYKFVVLISSEINAERGGFFLGLPFYINSNLEVNVINNIFKKNGLVLDNYPYPLHYKYLTSNYIASDFKNTNYLQKRLLFISKKHLFLKPFFLKRKINKSLFEIKKLNE